MKFVDYAPFSQFSDPEDDLMDILKSKIKFPVISSMFPGEFKLNPQ
jgi:hypothetical protein